MYAFEGVCLKNNNAPKYTFKVQYASLPFHDGNTSSNKCVFIERKITSLTAAVICLNNRTNIVAEYVNCFRI